MNINEKFYDGFEGEPKITFCLMKNNIIVEKSVYGMDTLMK